MPDLNISSPYDFAAPPSFEVTVDIALFSIRDGAVHVVLGKREESPTESRWALPGGFLREHEDFDQAATRELVEATGLPPDHNCHLEQLGARTSGGDDPRKRFVTVAYLAVCAEKPLLRAVGGTALTHLPVVQAIELGLLTAEREQIVRHALERIRANLEHTTLAATFLPTVFTIGDLRGVYEAVWGAPLDRANFQRNFRRNKTCFVEREGPPPERMRRPGRPSQQWWSLKSPQRRGRHVSLLDHALMGPREAWRHRRDQAVGN